MRELIRHILREHTREIVEASTNKLTQDEFIRRSKDAHGEKYDYSRVKYVNANTDVTIKCPTHGYFEQRPSKHMMGQGCDKCANEIRGKRTPKDEYVKSVSKIYGDKYDYTTIEYKNNRTPITIKCNKHGYFQRNPREFLRGVECDECMAEKKTSDFINKSEKVHNGKYTYDKTKYTHSQDEVLIKCPEHGYFPKIAVNHLMGQGCPICTKEKNDAAQTRTLSDFISLSRKKHGDKYDYSNTKYTNAREDVEILCPEHGPFIQRASAHYGGQGCPVCSESKGERLISRILEENNVKFKRQHKFEDCKNEVKGTYCRKLPFDFYIPGSNTTIEFDGIQHFEPVQIFGGEDKFEYNRKLDIIKNNYCEKNGIKLIRIPYTMSPEEIEIYLLMELGITE